MSPRSSSPKGKKAGGGGAKAQAGGPDVFVGLLLVSTAALLTGIIFLVLELNKYDFQMAS